MPYRTASIILILFGSVFVIGLILLGRDLHRAARSGPNWKRKLVAAGLVLLAAVGFTTGCDDQGGWIGGGATSGAGLDDPIPSDRPLEETAQWRQIAGVWREAEEIASGKRGDYPFDEKGKKKILDDVAVVADSIQRLHAAALLDDAEAGLMQEELALLKTRVIAKRPTEMRNATCYEPKQYTPAQDSLKRLGDRLPLLEKIAKSETLQPRVVSKVLDTIEKDLTVLGKEEMRDRLPEERRADAEEILQRAKPHVEKIKSKLEGGSNAFQGDPRWRGVVDAWNAAAPLAKNSKSTTAQREAVDAKLEAAKLHIGGLTEDGLLSDAESKLLLSEAAHLRERMYRDPPTDCQVECYDMALVIPAQKSLQRINQRLPLLKQLAAEGKIHPAALRKVLGSVENDIKMLSTEDELKQLAAEKQENARQLRQQAEATVAEIKKLLEESE